MNKTIDSLKGLIWKKDSVRFLPAKVEQYLNVDQANDMPHFYWNRAVKELGTAYTSGTRLLIGIGVWALAIVEIIMISIAIIATFDNFGNRTSVLGIVALLAAVIPGVIIVRLAGDLIKSGSILSKSAEAWLLTTYEVQQSTVFDGVYAFFIVLRPEIYPRLILSSIAGVGTVISAACVVYAIVNVMAEPVNAVIWWVFVLMFSAFTIAFVIPSVSLWRGLTRIQWILLKNPEALSN